MTLSFLEIVLGIDNIIFISIVAGKLPVKQQRKARNLGLLLAMFFRIGLLLSITWIISLKDPVLTIPAVKGIWDTGIALSYKDLILIAGGLFLIVKSTLEIHHKLKDELKISGHTFLESKHPPSPLRYLQKLFRRFHTLLIRYRLRDIGMRAEQHALLLLQGIDGG